VATTDPLGHVAGQSYDALGRVVATVDADGNRTTYAYDAADELWL
jgi:YD repeat-containing protein